MTWNLYKISLKDVLLYSFYLFCGTCCVSVNCQAALEDTEELESSQQQNRWVSIRRSLVRLYETFPINFSAITGLSHWDIPRLKGNIFVGRFFDIEKDGILSDVTAAATLAEKHYSGACYFWLPLDKVLVVTKPAHVKQILLHRDESISRGTGIGMNFPRIFGKSIFFDEGHLWRAKRTVFKNFLYLNEPLEEYVPCVRLLARKHIKSIVETASVSCDLEEFFTNFTLDVVGRTLLGCNTLSEYAKALKRIFSTGTRAASSPCRCAKSRFSALYSYFFKEEEYVEFESYSHELRRFFEKEILPHCQPRAGNHFLKAIFHMEEEVVEGKAASLNPDLSASDLADFIFLTFASHSTTTSAFQFIVKLLSAHPQIAERLRHDLRQSLDETFSMDEIENVQYLDWVIKEAMRLFPPVPFLERGVTKSFELADVPASSRGTNFLAALKEEKRNSIFLASGTSVVIPTYFIHRSAQFFHHPEDFIPERFAPEYIKDIPEYTYLPFGAGPKFCVGQRFAMQVLKMMLAQIYYNFEIDITNNDMSIDPLEIILTPRTKPVGRFKRVASPDA